MIDLETGIGLLGLIAVGFGTLWGIQFFGEMKEKRMPMMA